MGYTWILKNVGRRSSLSLSVLLRRCSSSAPPQPSPAPAIRPIDKVLIANRGEIACRVIRTARKLGIQTVAVYSDVDKNAMHVQMADEAYRLGPAPSQESYLRGDLVLKVAQQSNSQAVHPGYGFLSESLEFAEACQQSGVIFIGPPSSAIRDMGIKSTSKSIMSAAGVPIIEGYHGDDQSLETLQREAKRIGFPLMIKAVRGGGGKGMRIAETEADFLGAVESAKRESLKAFGDDNLLLERYIQDPRHVEVQVFADTHGNAVHLFERDCSVQRRHQKIIEEAPAPGISEETRQALGAAAVRAARAVGYVGAGTVEFILDRQTHSFHFMEMNTRLQVEHPITEMITGTDLVEWQLKVASGMRLPLLQDQITRSGHAFEARLYAEDPRGGFLPGAGSLRHLSTPRPDANTRVETGVRQGDDVSVHYDPMIAKLVTWGKDRREGLARLTGQLADYQIVGLETNVNFLISLATHKAFQAGDVHTAFIPEHEKELFPALKLTDKVVAQAALAEVLHEQLESASWMKDDGIHVPPVGWRPNYQLTRDCRWNFNEENITATVTYEEKPGTFTIQTSEGKQLSAKAKLSRDANQLTLDATIDGATCRCQVVFCDNTINIFDKTGKTTLSLPPPKFLASLGAASSSGSSSGARSPMPGVLDRVLVSAGDQVVEGQPLFAVVAMKMEYVVRAPRKATVKSVASCKPGESVPKGMEIVSFEEEAETKD